MSEYDPTDPRLDQLGKSIASLRDYAINAAVERHGPPAGVVAAEVADTALFYLIARHGDFFTTTTLVVGVAADGEEKFDRPLGEFVLDVGGVTAEMIFHEWIERFSSFPTSEP